MTLKSSTPVTSVNARLKLGKRAPSFDEMWAGKVGRSDGVDRMMCVCETSDTISQNEQSVMMSVQGALVMERYA
ncbi:protein of unknown function [Taphrina deformans PYCC 5710]|uniref:Uncharacterized protein n=1 Tax=Taphrina deformans (strain PYCC 5710 / ATCC 11124 / CBS 356.35 / IMI 108563 / JCM 9778 / NBRC 8474) TaxID=1097556 RepID=R4X7M4_TAPDE|nr:protein of unknown function [Taphrina deformans PYCC 5710]|eukprot:CCG81431.1 protein of unknown function [Taphrina deformans PYCC 5710]